MRQSRQGGPPPRARPVQLTRRHLEVERTYLALDDADAIRPARSADPAVTFERLDACPVALYRQLYRDVGAEWYWHDRLDWSDEALAEHLAQPSVAVWLVRHGGTIAGYFELQRHQDASVEIVYFGLTRPFMGRGIGGAALERAAREAFAMGASRVWLHTCTLDSPRALPAYRARGFSPFRTERLEVELDGASVVSERLLPTA